MPNLNNTLPTLQQLPQQVAEYALERAQDRDGCQIRARNDYEAVQCWLREYAHKETTHRVYQKEAERFLLWCISEQMKCFAMLDREDMEQYLNFLSDPQPAAKWCSSKTGRGVRRGDPAWRPFTGPLSESAKRTAVSSVDSMLSYLVEARYISFNPLVLIKKKYRNKNTQVLTELNLHERMLSPDEWQIMLITLDEMPEGTMQETAEKARLRFLISILFLLGLRVNELVTHNWNAFRKVDDLWWFYVLGKGDKPARIPVNDALLREVIMYRKALNRAPYPGSDDQSPLLASFKNGRAISSRHVNKLLKELALQTVKKFVGDQAKINKIKKFSAHWLRHMSASMQDRAGVQFKHIRANHRHENDETTRKYVHAIDRERHDEMQKLQMMFND